MAFDDKTRTKLARLVGDARKLLVTEFTEQLQELYGIQPDGAIADLSKLTHLDDEQLATATRLRERIAHLASGFASEKKPLVAGIARALREQAFTILNRFAALRMCEERGLLHECVGNGFNSKGFKVYQQVAGAGLGDIYHRYRAFIFVLFDELALDLGVLFDRFSPFGLLFPREQSLLGLLEVLNQKELKHIWAEDETIGWVYQYFNPPEERKAMREASSAPRNSRELAVRNQFFTPRYVVEFLSDNTLGRIWYEMTRGETRLKDVCRYLVRRPSEVFLSEEQQPPPEPRALNPEPLTQEELLREPVFIPYRSVKDPRTIRMLDPACGSMHFGLYCFDLYELIYEEAWDIEERLGAQALICEPGMSSLQEAFASKEDFLCQIPRLIIEHNIHGIDIDPRCAQIAGLSLWLRAQKSWQKQGLKPMERHRITKSNIVCAEPMPGSKELLQEFTATLPHKAIGQLVELIFDKMQLAGEAGSLLKIEEEIRDIVAEAKKQWKSGPKAEQGLLFAETKKPKQAELLVDTSGVTDEEFWEKAEENIYEALAQYAESAQNGHSFARRLFAEDAARGFAFIDLCRKRYDVALMNPPFGEAATTTVEYIISQYPEAFIDLLAAFIERAFSLCGGGRVGALTSRACLYTRTLADWRKNRFLPSVEEVVDLGGAVLDGAMVFACASVFAAPASCSPISQTLDLRSVAAKEDALLQSIQALQTANLAAGVHVKERDQLAKVNNSRFLYNIPNAFWEWSQQTMTLVDAGGSARAGSTTYDDFRFLRLAWEVPTCLVGWDGTWVFFSKGGYFETFYNDIHLMVNWHRDGREVGEFNRIGYGTDAQSRRASTFYRQPGVTYPRRTIKGFSPRAFPSDCIFADKGPVVFSPQRTHPAFALGYLNSSPVRALIHLQVQAGSFETGVVNTIPWLTHESAVAEICRLANDIWRRKAEAYRIWDLDRRFVPPTLRTVSSIGEFWKNMGLDVQKQSDAIVQQCRTISDVVSQTFALPEIDYEAFEVSPDDHRIQDEFGMSEFAAPSVYVCQFAVACAYGRWDIRYATGERSAQQVVDPFAPLPVCPPGTLQNSCGLPTSAEDVSSDYPLRISWPGILADDLGHSEDLERRVRDVLEVIWEDRADAIEREACEILGVKFLRDYFRRPAGFFADHLKRYSKSRRQAPIYWPLSTASGSYTLWVYYHRLTDQTLFTCVKDFVDPKLAGVTKDIARLRSQLATDHRPLTTGQLDELVALEQELRDFRDELLRLTKLPYKPDLNDGVLISACPLWKLFRLSKWQKDLKACWEALADGDYDWAHLAYAIWPDRVTERCKKDRSLAIAHGLEHLCTVEPPKSKGKKGKKPIASAELPQLGEDF